MGVTPTTAAIHHLEYADDAARRRSSTRPAKREPIPLRRGAKFAVGGDARRGATRSTSSRSAIPRRSSKERILLVDTPGVNDLSLQRADITYSYIPRADAVLFLLDAGQILKESERVFLQEKLLRRRATRSSSSITKWDIWSDDEQKEALAYAKTSSRSS